MPEVVTKEMILELAMTVRAEVEETAAEMAAATREIRDILTRIETHVAEMQNLRNLRNSLPKPD